MKLYMSKKGAEKFMKRFNLDKLPDNIEVLPDRVELNNPDVKEVERRLNDHGIQPGEPIFDECKDIPEWVFDKIKKHGIV